MYDLSNWEELKTNKIYNYDLKEEEYLKNMSNEVVSTYDQFIQLRDTLIYSKKTYSWKAWAYLVVWDKEHSIELLMPNRFMISFDSWTTINIDSVWDYITYRPDAWFWPIAVEINKTWRYSIEHKAEILLDTDTTKGYCYVDWYRKDESWNYQKVINWWTAVFDNQWDTLWEVFTKMTAQWFISKDILAWDLLVYKAKDQDWNDLQLQSNSNFFNIEYIDLATKYANNGNYTRDTNS